MFRTVSLSNIRSLALYTQQWYRSYMLCWMLASGILIPLASSQHNLYDINLLLCVQCWTPDDVQRYCPKHVDLYSKNKFVKLVLLIGFIIRIYNDAQSSECRMNYRVYIKLYKIVGLVIPWPLIMLNIVYKSLKYIKKISVSTF